MVKKRYYGNEGLSLAWDSIKLSSVALFITTDDQPDAEESKKFWGDIWSELVNHNTDVKWLKDLQSEVNVAKQEKVDITKENLKKILA